MTGGTRQLFAVILWAVASEAVATSPPPVPAPFGWLGSLAGACWSGELPNGTLHTHCYSTQYGMFLRGTARLESSKEGAVRTLFEGDSVFAWDEGSKRIVYSIWGSDGSYRQLEARFEGEEILFPVTSRTQPEQVLFRSAWRRIDADRFEVRRERPRESGWATQFTVLYRRAGS